MVALKTILNKQTDFTGEFPEEWARAACGGSMNPTRMRTTAFWIPLAWGGVAHQQLERHQRVPFRKPSGELLPA